MFASDMSAMDKENVAALNLIEQPSLPLVKVGSRETEQYKDEEDSSDTDTVDGNEKEDEKDPFTLEMEVDEEISFKPLASLRERYQNACQSISKKSNPVDRLSLPPPVTVTVPVIDHITAVKSSEAPESTSHPEVHELIEDSDDKISHIITETKTNAMENAVDVLSEIDTVMSTTVICSSEPLVDEAVVEPIIYKQVPGIHACEFCLAEFASKEVNIPDHCMCSYIYTRRCIHILIDTYTFSCIGCCSMLSTSSWNDTAQASSYTFFL